MKRLPIRRVSVPVKSSSLGSRSNIEVLHGSTQYHFVCRTTFRIFRDQMTALMPRNPFTSSLSVCLNMSHLFDKLVVDGHIIFITKEVWNNNHIVMLQSSWVLSYVVWPKINSQFRAHKCALRKETFCIPPRLCAADYLAHSGIIVHRSKILVSYAIPSVDITVSSSSSRCFVVPILAIS